MKVYVCERVSNLIRHHELVGVFETSQGAIRASVNNIRSELNDDYQYHVTLVKVNHVTTLITPSTQEHPVSKTLRTRKPGFTIRRHTATKEIYVTTVASYLVKTLTL